MNKYYINKKGTDLYLCVTDSSFSLDSKDKASIFDTALYIEHYSQLCKQANLFGFGDTEEPSFIKVPVKECVVSYGHNDSSNYLLSIQTEAYRPYWTIEWTQDIWKAKHLTKQEAVDIASTINTLVYIANEGNTKVTALYVK